MKANVFVEIAQRYGFNIENLQEQGSCELKFDDKHTVVVTVEASSLQFKALIIQLSSDDAKKLQQIKTALKASLALVKTTFAIPYRDGILKKNENDHSVELSHELKLFRQFDCRQMPQFEVEKELESFLAALEVYKSRLVDTRL